jgi:hypothetical protein
MSGQRAEHRDPPDGHWVTETAPDAMLAALTMFLIPERSRRALASSPMTC